MTRTIFYTIALFILGCYASSCTKKTNGTSADNMSTQEHEVLGTWYLKTFQWHNIDSVYTFQGLYGKISYPDTTVTYPGTDQYVKFMSTADNSMTDFYDVTWAPTINLIYPETTTDLPSPFSLWLWDSFNGSGFGGNPNQIVFLHYVAYLGSLDNMNYTVFSLSANQLTLVDTFNSYGNGSGVQTLVFSR